MKMNSKKKKIIAIIAICIVVVLCMIVVKEVTSEYQIGDFSYSGSPWKGPMRSGVKAKRNIFEKDDVTLRLYYGFYDKDKRGHVTGYRQEREDKVLVAIYIYDSACGYTITNDCEIVDYKNVDNYYFIKGISQEEMFSEEYAYGNKFMSGMTYEHSEFITIPEDFFKEDKGTIVIDFTSYIEPREEGDCYYSMVGTNIELDYEITKDGKVKITNLERK